MHTAVVDSAEGTLKAGKTFIGVVGTLSLIVEKLPTTPKKQRAQVITEHVANMPGTQRNENPCAMNKPL